jgi:hypothetical protein
MNKNRKISGRFLRVSPPYRLSKEWSFLVDRAMRPATLGLDAVASAWYLGPAPALSGGGIYLHDTCYQKKSHIGTF